jgi:hypothetical protein
MQEGQAQADVRNSNIKHRNNQHSEQARALHTHAGRLNSGPRQFYSTCWRRRHAQNMANAGRLWWRGTSAIPGIGLSRAASLVVSRRYLIVVPRPLPTAPLVVRRRYLAVVPKSMPAAPRRYVLVHEVLELGVQAVACDATRFASQVLGRCP